MIFLISFFRVKQTNCSHFCWSSWTKWRKRRTTNWKRSSQKRTRKNCFNILQVIYFQKSFFIVRIQKMWKSKICIKYRKHGSFSFSDMTNIIWLVNCNLIKETSILYSFSQEKHEKKPQKFSSLTKSTRSALPRHLKTHIAFSMRQLLAANLWRKFYHRYCTQGCRKRRGRVHPPPPLPRFRPCDIPALHCHWLSGRIFLNIKISSENR